MYTYQVKALRYCGLCKIPSFFSFTAFYYHALYTHATQVELRFLANFSFHSSSNFPLLSCPNFRSCAGIKCKENCLGNQESICSRVVEILSKKCFLRIGVARERNAQLSLSVWETADAWDWSSRDVTLHILPLVSSLPHPVPFYRTITEWFSFHFIIFCVCTYFIQCLLKARLRTKNQIDFFMHYQKCFMVGLEVKVY